MSEANKALARQGYQAMTTGNFALIEQMLAPNFVDHNPDPGQRPDAAGVIESFRAMHVAFPDFTMKVHDMIAEGDKVVAQLTMEGTQKGDFLGIPATGKRVSVQGIDIIRIVDGKVVERWGQFDQMGMLQQLGILPSQE